MPGVLVLQPDGSMASLREAPFAEEARFQELLAQYHDLLAGDQIDPETPRRWLFVDREVGVPEAADAADRWSLDHLFIDQDAIPTFVEVKRASDTRTRREVVAQMLDYAANGSAYWPVETIRELFEQRCGVQGKEPDEELQTLLGENADVEAFWRTVKTNLQAGRIRLMFVADDVPAPLRRIVEFLNEQMDPAEVLAVEVRQYEGQGIRTLVPRLIGQTEQARVKKGTERERRSAWDEESFFAKLAERGDEGEGAACRRIFDWCRAHFTSIDYGHGTKIASFIPFQKVGAEWFSPLRVYTGYAAAFVEIPLGQMKTPPFDDLATKREYVRRLNALPGVSIGEDLTKFPSVPVNSVADPEGLRRFLEVIDWTLQRVNASPSPA